MTGFVTQKDFEDSAVALCRITSSNRIQKMALWQSSLLSEGDA